MKSLILLLTLFATMATQATIISSSGNCPGDAGCDPGVAANYGFDMSLSSSDDLTWAFTLDNVSTDTNTLIDLFAINMGGTLGTDFTVANFDPASWTVVQGTGGVQFDYLGASGAPGDRLGFGESLTFDFIFTALTDYTNWTNSVASLGTGIGGGNDLGQIAVSFQSLGMLGEDSDLIGDSWQYICVDCEPTTNRVPEPGPLALMAIGLLGMRRFFKHKELKHNG